MSEEIGTKRIDDFKKELKELLSKYNASINFGISSCSDTHGLSEERIEVDIKGNTTILNYGYGVDEFDL